MNIKKLLSYIWSHRLRRCIYCGKWKLCEYIYFAYGIKKDSELDIDTIGIDGYFCDSCHGLPIEDIFTKLKDKQYPLSKIYHAMGWDNIKGGDN